MINFIEKLFNITIHQQNYLLKLLKLISISEYQAFILFFISILALIIAIAYIAESLYVFFFTSGFLLLIFNYQLFINKSFFQTSIGNWLMKKHLISFFKLTLYLDFLCFFGIFLFLLYILIFKYKE